MELRKILLLGFILVLTAGTVLAYTGTGGSNGVPVTECNDGNDNDDDGKVDGNDPGCTEPLYADNSEGDIYDLDASWVFSGKSIPTGNGPSLFFGSKVVEEGNTNSPFKDEPGSTSDSVNESYVENAHEEWGGGDPQGEDVTVSNSVQTDRSSSQYQLVKDPSSASSNQCGNGLQDSGEDKNSCPEDYGMADVLLIDSIDLPDTASQSEVYYDVEDSTDQLQCQELSDSTSESIDVTDGKNHVFGVASKSGQLDYIVDKGALGSGNNDKILSVGCTADSSSKTKITDVDDYDYTTSDVDLAGSSTTAYTEYGEASSSQSTYCDNYDTKYEAKLKEKTDTVTEDANMLGVKQDSTTGGAEEEVTDHQVDIDITYDVNALADGASYDKCTETSTYYDNCDYSSLDGASCSENYSVSVYNLDKDNTKNTGTSSTTVDIYYRDYKLTTSEHYDVSKESDAVGTVTGSSDSPYSNSEFVFSSGAFFTDKSSKENSLTMGNDPAVARSAFKINVPSGTGGNFQATRDEFLSLDADGPNGQGDGYVAADEGASGNKIVGSTPDFLTKEVSGDSITDDYISTSDVPNIDCPYSKTKCMASVDVYLKQTGWDSKSSNAFGFNFAEGNPYATNESLGVCEMYKDLTGDPGVNCRYDSGGNGPTGDSTRVCGDDPGEYWAYMEGPEVDESVLDDNPAHYEACLSTAQSDVTKSSCINKEKVVPEGTVANVAPQNSSDQYEEGGNSPDNEVCLDLEGTGISNEGDEVAGDNKNDDMSQEDYGGEWYDLDSEIAQKYIRGVRDGSYTTLSGRTLVSDSSNKDSNGDGSYDSNDIDWYWRYNPNPSHSNYNPEGESYGISLENDCGNTRFSSDSIQGCNDAEKRPSSGDVREPTFYSFFTEGKRDDDYHPQGEDKVVDNAIFFGYINKLSDMSDQLEAGMATTNYYTSATLNPDMWNNSNGEQNKADQWAITQNLNWSISSRGVPYPPWGTYYRSSTGHRSNPGTGSVAKMRKAFGNSYAAVAGTSMTDDNGDSVDPGDGVWIDPDYLKNAWNSGDFRWDPSYSDWRDSITFKMDITGPDSGIGFDLGDGTGVDFKGSSGNQKAVVYGDIYFQGEEDNLDNDGDGDVDEGPSSQAWEGTDQVGETVTETEPPVCGDDQKEFLLEEMGESKRSAQYDGMYACARTSNVCVDMSSTPRIVEKEEYSQANEPDENVGRLKSDLEICEQRPEDDTSLWYDQDYGDITGNGEQDTCRTNNLYNQRGVRWIDSDYVQNYPHAVTGGIDDDWNQYIDDNYNTGNSDEYTEKYESRPDKSSWNFGSESPVPSGARSVGNDSIASLGFCGGDDDGEYLVTQECQTGLCETDRSIQGVAKNPDSCVLEPSTFSSGYSIDTNNRSLYGPGEEVEVDIGSDTRKIACFNNVWYEDWPVVFNQDNVEVPFGSSTTTSFQVINVQSERTTFEVEMIDPLTDDPSAYQHSTFVSESGDSFETTVAPQSSETFHVEIQGANKAIGDPSKSSEDDLTIRASAVNSDMEGEDLTTVEVVNNTATNTSVGSTEPQSVPGIGAIQIMAMIMMSSAVFFLQS